MSLMPMYKTCIHCKRRYTYNPSVGNLGMVCRHCGKLQVKADKKTNIKKNWSK